MSKRIDNVSDLRPDATNANKGTQRGRGMVESSLRETGAGRSILADKNGQVIAGNKTLEAWVDIGGEIEVVRTNGEKLVVVQREDLDLSDDTGMARKLAYYDNRASEVGLEWDTEQLLADLNAGVDLLSMFRQDELDELLNVVTQPDDPNEHWQGMPEFKQEDLTSFRSIHVHFKTQEDVDAFAELIGQKIGEKTRSLWHPEVEQTDMYSELWANES